MRELRVNCGNHQNEERERERTIGINDYKFDCSLWDELFSRERDAHKHFCHKGRMDIFW